jgi:hypothetical protein
VSESYTKSYQVDGKQLCSPHIDVTFKPTNGQSVLLRFNGPLGESRFANALRIGEWITLTIGRDE